VWVSPCKPEVEVPLQTVQVISTVRCSRENGLAHPSEVMQALVQLPKHVPTDGYRCLKVTLDVLGFPRHFDKLGRCRNK